MVDEHGSSSRARGRVRLWLRAERAMGLRSLPVPAVEMESAAPVSAMPATPVTRAATAPMARPAAGAAAAVPTGSPAPARGAALFGAESAGVGARAPVAVAVAGSNLPSFTAPVLSTEEKTARLREMDEQEVRGCTRCGLCRTRSRTVFGEGDVDAQIMFIGEGPGATEDATGRPFVGRAGELLDRMIAGMGLKRQQVFIANIVKCRAYVQDPQPKDRAPTPEEVATCTPYLQRQIEIIRPKVIVTLGLPATKYMLGEAKITMTRVRGQWHTWRGIKLMPTFHPAYVLRNYIQETRAAVWEDLKKVMAELGLPAPARGKET